MNARQIIRSAYGTSKNGMTPHVYKIVSVKRGEIAAEISYGSGMFGNDYLMGVSVARKTDWDKAERAHAPMSTSFSGDSFSALLRKVYDHIENLKEELA